MATKVPYAQPDRSPVIAGLLSLILPGLGQVYGRQRYRGGVIFIIELLALLACAFISLLVPLLLGGTAWIED